jgi:glycosyltransferase involved in cell wall biosynthesis
MSGRRVLNVLSVIPDLYFGGAENRLLNIAQTIDPERFHLTVVTLYSSDPKLEAECGGMQSQFVAAGTRVLNLALRRPDARHGPRAVKVADTATILGTAIAKLRRLIGSTRTDLVDAHIGTSLWTAVPAAASARVPATITLYNETELFRINPKRSYTHFFWPRIQRFNLRLASAVFTDSDEQAVELAQFMGRASPPVYVVPNGVRLPAAHRSRADVLTELGIPPDTKATIIGQVSSLVPYKGLAVLLDAAHRLSSAGLDIYFVFIGYPRLDRDYPNYLRQQAERLSIADRVRICGYPGSIADVWNVIDIHVHASLLDSLPTAIIEGMSLGKPAVVTDVGGIPRAVRNGQTGLVVPSNNAKAFGDALLRLLQDDAYAKRLGQAAYELYLKRYTPEVMTRQVERCFEDIVQATQSRRGIAG